MTRSERFPAGTPCWVDINVPDLDVARTFYSSVLGWTIPPGDEQFGGYTQAHVDGSVTAGLGPIMGEWPTAWTLYFATDDADATLAAAEANGGTVLLPADDVGDFGRMAIVAEPSGAVFGVWQGHAMLGFDAPGEPGSLAWTDLRSADPDRSRDFYAAVFGYDYQPLEMAGPDYATFSLPGGPPLGGMGGMMGAPDGVPPHWLVYFAVDDADASAAAATRLGGTSLAPPFDTEFGRMGPLADPFGAPFWTVQLPDGE